MKWNTPELGDKRKVKKFAWLPTYCGDGLMIWLEYYIAEQEYRRYLHGSNWKNKKITPLN